MILKLNIKMNYIIKNEKLHKIQIELKVGDKNDKAITIEYYFDKY